MGVKSAIIDVTVENLASTRLTTGLGIGTFLAGVANKLGIEGMTIDSFAVLSGALITIGVGVITGYVKLSEWKARKRLYRIAEQRYKTTCTIPEELLDGLDKKESSGTL